jgi:hypothetical protein
MEGRDMIRKAKGKMLNAKQGKAAPPRLRFAFCVLHFALTSSLISAAIFGGATSSHAQAPASPNEMTPESRAALDLGLQWLAANQGPEGNWGSNDLGLVSIGALAFLADGHMPGRGQYGATVEKALNFVLKNAKPSGLLNIAGSKRDMYNHGLSTFVLGQAHGMTNDPRIGTTLDRALKLIAEMQCQDGGWQYEAQRRPQGNDLSLLVMQAKALRSAVDSGLEVSPDVITLAIKRVRGYYYCSAPEIRGRKPPIDEELLKRYPGRFTYAGHGGNATTAMAAAGVVSMQEFGQYDDWRIPKNMDVIKSEIGKLNPPNRGSGRLPSGFDSYTLYYVGQALYQVGGDDWRGFYPKLRDALVVGQARFPSEPKRHGQWVDDVRVSGPGSPLYATGVACFILAIPNRYLPILQEGRIEEIRRQFDTGGGVTQ